MNHGADLEKQDSRGWTCLFFAARNWKPSIVELLIECGANVKAVDFFGRPALTAAIRQFGSLLDRRSISSDDEVTKRQILLQIVSLMLSSGSLSNNVIVDALYAQRGPLTGDNDVIFQPLIT